MGPDISGTRGDVGDVATAIMEIDSSLKRVHGTDAGQQRPDELAAGQVVPTVAQAREVLTGYCTVIYLFITLWRNASESSGKDLLAEVISGTVTRLREMTRTVAPCTIPTMAALMTAAAIRASPDLWRAQFGDWRAEELSAVQATALLLAEGINRSADDPDAALRLIMDALASADEDGEDDERSER
jgi:hypothetical protein